MYNDLVELDTRTVIETVPFDKVEFGLEEADEGNRLFAKFGDHSVQVRQSPKQFEVLCNAFGVPFKFAEDLPQELLGDIFRTLGQSKGNVAYNWALDGVDNELRSFGEAKKPYIPYSRIGSIFEKNGFTDLNGFIGRNGIGEITAVSPTRASIEPRVGDVTQSGILYRGNPLNHTPPVILPFSYRLVCTNGMTSMQERERINVVGHDVDDVLEQIEYQAQRAFEFAERLNHRFADLVSHEVDPVQAMNNLIVSRRVPRNLHQNLRDEAASLPEGFRTMYDVLNIFTRYATGQYDPNRRLELQAIGGDIALSEHLNCSRCGSVLE